MVTVRVSETYDLSTQIDKMGLVGIHTPSRNAINAFFPGLLQNHRFAKLVGCDVTLACASMLPADPQQIGVEEGDIAPQDMFNPLLYKAMSNESFNTVLNRIIGSAQHVGTGAESVEMTDIELPEGSVYDDFDVYYGLLGDTDGWRKAMPQAGLEMKGLFPMVYQTLSQYGQMDNMLGINNYLPQLNGDGAIAAQVGAKTIRGHPCKMPRMPLHGATTPGGVDNNIWFPTTYVACIITPPAKLNKLYYRLKVTWTIDFQEVCPISEYRPFHETAYLGYISYGTDYVEQSKEMDTKDETVDVRNANLEHVMTSAR